MDFKEPKIGKIVDELIAQKSLVVKKEKQGFIKMIKNILERVWNETDFERISLLAGKNGTDLVIRLYWPEFFETNGVTTDEVMIYIIRIVDSFSFSQEELDGEKYIRLDLVIEGIFEVEES